MMEYAWVLERGSAPAYLSVLDGRFFWTFDHTKALRFAREQDATAMIPLAPLWAGVAIRVAQHGWAS